MKKIAVWSLFLVMLAASGFAAEPVGPDAARVAHRQEMKAIKATQRQTRETNKASQNPADKKPGFWDREGERSGLGNSGNKVSTFFRNMNPVPFFKNQQEKYNARKGAAGTATTGSNIK